MKPIKAVDAAALAGEWTKLSAEKPKMRIRDAAAELGVSEAQLLATRVGDNVTRLEPKFEEILQSLHRLGRIMALTRNEEIVHERKGVYQNVEIMQGHGKMGIAVNEDIDLRIFFAPWKFAFASIDDGARGTMRSIQFFDASGDAIHKVYLTADSNIEAYDEIVNQFSSDDQTKGISVEPRAEKTADKPDSEIDIAGFRQAWADLKDTHDFFPMLRKFGVAREQALKIADPEMSQPVDRLSFRYILEQASERELPIMVFVGNHGMIQIHTGPVKNVVDARGWFNVMDEPFNLHIDQDNIATAYVVKKPTDDGIVTSLELFNKDGENVALIFGKRKPGIPEDGEWQKLIADLLKG